MSSHPIQPKPVRIDVTKSLNWNSNFSYVRRWDVGMSLCFHLIWCNAIWVKLISWIRYAALIIIRDIIIIFAIFELKKKNADQVVAFPFFNFILEKSAFFIALNDSTILIKKTKFQHSFISGIQGWRCQRWQRKTHAFEMDPRLIKVISIEDGDDARFVISLSISTTTLT